MPPTVEMKKEWKIISFLVTVLKFSMHILIVHRMRVAWKYLRQFPQFPYTFNAFACVKVTILLQNFLLQKRLNPISLTAG